MDENNRFFCEKEDYEEPRCPLCEPNTQKRIPIGRVIEKLDEYLAKNDYAAAERHLAFWKAEAEECGDREGALSVCNEQIGLFRKTNQKEKGLSAIADALSLAESLGLQNTVSGGTTYLNAATGYKAFDMPQTALPLYEKTKVLYETYLLPNDTRLAGLYNNMAITLTALCNFENAEKTFFRALSVLEQNVGKEADMAITYLNLCDLVSASLKSETAEGKIDAYIQKAEALLDTPTLPHDGYYAFVCEKCAPVFGYYGYFLAENKYRKTAEEIYGRT